MITEYDDWVHERIESNCFWIVKLSNGKQVYQDDERYLDGKPAILRLKEYVEENNLKIEEIYIRFRSHWEKAYDGDHDGVYFRRMILGSLFQKNSNFLIIGHIDGNKAYCKKWVVPEIICTEEEVREIDPEKEEGVIWNSKTD